MRKKIVKNHSGREEARTTEDGELKKKSRSGDRQDEFPTERFNG
jgi:hypothetical protein